MLNNPKINPIKAPAKGPNNIEPIITGRHNSEFKWLNWDNPNRKVHYYRYRR